MSDGREPAPCPGRQACPTAKPVLLGSYTGYCPQTEKTALVAIVPNDRPWERVNAFCARLEKGHELRAQLRKHAINPRIAICGTRVFGDPTIVTRDMSTGDRRAHYTGVILCNRTGCPVCCEVKARRFEEQVLRMLGAGATTKFKTIEVDGEKDSIVCLNGQWQHVICTVAHTAGDSWASIYDRLLDGLRELSKGVAGKVMFHLVNATARGTETTYSFDNGWHPHFHILWHVSRPLLEAEKALIKDYWARRTGAHPEHGLKFGRLFDCTASVDDPREAARYVAKLGHEISGGYKHPLPGHFLLAEVFDRAAQGDRHFIGLVQEYQQATHGRRLWQLDRRATRLRDHSPELPELIISAEYVTTIDRLEFSGLSRIERSGLDRLAVYWPLEAAIMTRGDPAAAIGETVTALLQQFDRGPPRLCDSVELPGPRPH